MTQLEERADAGEVINAIKLFGEALTHRMQGVFLRGCRLFCQVADVSIIVVFQETDLPMFLFPWCPSKTLLMYTQY